MLTFREKILHGKKLIKQALEEFATVKVACSFGKDSMLVLHLALQIDPDISVFTVLTPMKPKETRTYLIKISEDWKLNLKIFMSLTPTVPNPFLWSSDPDECCRIFKVEPTKEALQGVDCWITGLRNTEGGTRKDYREVEHSSIITKLNPILQWTEREVWQYLATHAIPVHPYYKLGYRSLGCEPCTAIVGEDQDERDGRWQNTCKKAGECGIHTMEMK